MFSPSSEFLRPVQHYQPLLPCRIQHHHDGLRHLRNTVHQETAGLQPQPGALHGGRRKRTPLRDAGEVHIRLQVLLLAAVFLQRGGAAARLRGFYGNIAEREGSRERGMMRKRVTICTVPARRTRGTSTWHERCWSTAHRRWRSSAVLSGSSARLPGKRCVPTARQSNRCQGAGCKSFPYITRQRHLLHYDTFNATLIFHNNSFIDV